MLTSQAFQIDIRVQEDPTLGRRITLSFGRHSTLIDWTLDWRGCYPSLIQKLLRRNSRDRLGPDSPAQIQVDRTLTSTSARVVRRFRCKTGHTTRDWTYYILEPPLAAGGTARQSPAANPDHSGAPMGKGKGRQAARPGSGSSSRSGSPACSEEGTQPPEAAREERHSQNQQDSRLLAGYGAKTQHKVCLRQTDRLPRYSGRRSI